MRSILLLVSLQAVTAKSTGFGWFAPLALALAGSLSARQTCSTHPRFIDSLQALLLNQFEDWLWWRNSLELDTGPDCWLFDERYPVARLSLPRKPSCEPRF